MGLFSDVMNRLNKVEKDRQALYAALKELVERRERVAGVGNEGSDGRYARARAALRTSEELKFAKLPEEPKCVKQGCDGTTLKEGDFCTGCVPF